MEIYDISQEVFGCSVFPGDPSPEKKTLMSIGGGDIVNLTAFSMCAHNGTHVDAPYHFYDSGQTVDRISLDRFVGHAFVTFHDGDITAGDARAILHDAEKCDPRCAEMILVGGKAVVTSEAAEVFADRRIKLFGNESQTVGPENAPKQVHLIMLGAGIILLEGIRLDGIEKGAYILHAAPLCLEGADGSPCRATLMRL